MTEPMRSLTRRKFVTSAAVSALSVAVKRAGAAKLAKPQKKPNILWIMSNEHNASVAGCYGNKVIQTPHIDSLAQQGITFDAHYCNSPLCAPSRLSLTAGKYASRVDAWALTSELPDANIASLPRVLNAAGYESFLCGKQHYDYSRRYGFTEVGGNFNNWYKTGKGHRLPPTHLTQEKLSPPRFEEFHSGDNGSTVEHDRRVTTGAVDFLSNKAGNDEKPFFLFVGYLAPHFPLIVPEENVAKYRAKVGLPDIPKGFLDRLALNYKVQRAGFQEIDVPDDVVRNGRELYYGLTDWADSQIGQVLAALRLHPEVAENTVIIYSPTTARTWANMACGGRVACMTRRARSHSSSRGPSDGKAFSAAEELRPMLIWCRRLQRLPARARHPTGTASPCCGGWIAPGLHGRTSR